MAERVTAARFIGRAHELAELEAALADAGDGRPSLVFLAGESGVGKSRLLTEFRQRALTLGARDLGGECIELGEGELPYAPLVGAIRPLARTGDANLAELPELIRGELARLAPELAVAAGPDGGAGSAGNGSGETQRRLFEAILALLERLGETSPVVFWLEDLHWADRSTRAFLAFVARNLRDERVLVVCTYRSDELHRRHPLRPLLTELERGPGAKRIELRPFDRTELAAQLADILGAEPAPEVVDRLFSRSEGNPLFTEELLAAGLDGRGSLPPTLRDALLLRLDGLEPRAQEAMRILAVAGRADDTTLAAAANLPSAELREAIRETVAAHVAVPGDDGRLSFRHALLREVVYDDLLPGERSELHRNLARALERRLDDEGGVWLSAAVAHHYHRAGEQAEALRAAIRAAGEAEAVHAHGEAAALLDRALELWAHVDGAEQLAGADHPGLLARAAHAHYLSGDEARAASLLERQLGELDPDREPVRVAGALGELADTQWSLGMAGRSRETLQRALELLPDEPTPERARLRLHMVRFRLLQGRFGEVAELAAHAIADADALGLEEVRAGVLHRLGPALLALGETERGEAALREALELARRSGNNDELATAYLNYADALHYYGRTEEAEALAARGSGEVVPGDKAARELAMLRAEIAFDRGEWDRALELMPDGREVSSGSTLVNSLLRRAEQALGRGDTAAAQPLLRRAWSVLEGSIEPQYISATATLLTEVEGREGNTETARSIVDEALDRLQFCTEDAARLARIAAAGVAVEAGAAERARDLGDTDAMAVAQQRAARLLALVEAAVEDADRPLERARLGAARAEVARAVRPGGDPELWDRAARGWTEALRPYSAAQAKWRQAEAFMAAGERDAAAEAAREAREIAAGLGAVWLVAELDALAARGRLRLEREVEPATAADAEVDPFGLTERERQVLALVARGATNREIAGELFMAEKTASVHVSRILTKLDVRSRTEAAAVAVRQGLVAVDEAAAGESV
jgi:predicted ATPase/DNA-binding CsgD family transcriptional regulator